MLQYLFIPDRIVGYDFLIDTLKSKFPAFYSLTDSLRNLSVVKGNEKNWTMNLLVDGEEITVPVVDWTPVAGFLSITRLLIQAILYVWLGMYLLKQFDVKFNIG